LSADVTAGLARDLITDPLQGALQAAPRTSHAATSSCEDFISDEMHPDQLGHFPFVEMTADGITDALAQLVDSCCLRENALADSARNQAALWGVFYDEDDFAHTPVPINRILAQVALEGRLQREPSVSTLRLPKGSLVYTARVGRDLARFDLHNRYR